MTLTNEILTHLRADASQFVNEVKGASAEASNLGTTTDRMAAVGKAAFASLFAVAAVVVSASIKAASDYEVAHARLTTAVKNSGLEFSAVKDQVEAADSSMRKFGFTDTETENALSRLVPVTHSVGQAHKDLALAADVAAGRHISLEAATQILVRAETGHVASLGKLGVVTQDANGHLLTQQQVLDNLSKMYSGQASAAADTFQGRLKVVEAEVDHVAVTIGSALIPVLEQIASVGAGVVDFLSQHTALALALAAVIGGPLVASMVTWLATLVADAWSTGIEFLAKIGHGIITLVETVDGATRAEEALAAATDAMTAANAAAESADVALASIGGVVEAAFIAEEAAEAKLTEATVALAITKERLAESSAAAALVASGDVAAFAEEEAAEEAVATATEKLKKAKDALKLATEGSTAVEGPFTGAILGSVIATVGLAAAIGGVLYLLGTFDTEVTAAYKAGVAWAASEANVIESTHGAKDALSLLKNELKDVTSQQKALNDITAVVPPGSGSLERKIDLLETERQALSGNVTAQRELNRVGAEARVVGAGLIKSDDDLAGRKDALTKAIVKQEEEVAKQKFEYQGLDAQAKQLANTVGLVLPAAAEVGKAEWKKLSSAAQTASLTFANTKNDTDTLMGALGQAGARQFGVDLANVALKAGFTSDQMKALTKQAQGFANALEGSVSGFTSLFSHDFSKDITVEAGLSQKAFDDFFVNSHADANKWLDDLKTLMSKGVDTAFVDELAKAGPKSEPQLQAFIHLVDTQGVAWVNSVQHSGDAAEQAIEQAYDKAAISVAVKTAEITAVSDAMFKDIQSGGVSHLSELKTGGDAQFEALKNDAVLALTQMRIAASQPIGIVVDISQAENALHTLQAELHSTANFFTPEQAAAAAGVGVTGYAYDGTPIYGRLTAHGMVSLAGGDVVHGPTMALIGEAGAEAVLPLTRFEDMVGIIRKTGMADNVLAAASIAAGVTDRKKSGGGGASHDFPHRGGTHHYEDNSQVHIHMPPGSDGDDVVRAIQQYERRNGKTWRSN